jgi:peptidylprolyl isomerase
MKKYFLLAGAVLALASLSAQKKSEKKSKLKPITFEKAIENKLAVQKVVVKKESKKKGTQYSTQYIVDNYYQKFEDGMYAEFNTDSGRIICKLHLDKTPLTVCNFVGLAEGTMSNTFRSYGQPFYDNLKFHRVISKANGDAQDFMIQGGDPEGVGSGGPGYSFEDEFHPDLRHDGPGVLSMANSGPNTNGSQFFITHVETPWLNNRHSVFGKVIEGQDVVNKMRSNCGMQSIRIIRKGQAAIEFKADSASFEAIKEQKRREGDFANYDAEVLKRYPTAKKTESGLWYVLQQEGTGTQVKKGDQVAVHYRGMLSNGSEFDNSYKRSEPLEFNVGVGRVIQGWDEGIALMREGAKYILIIPSSLGYGSQGAGGVIPPNATLVFETELIYVAKVNPDADFATDDTKVMAKYPGAIKTPSGLWYKVIAEGAGENAEKGDEVSVHYKGTLADGKEFDNSIKSGQPFTFTLGTGSVIEGWDIGITYMKTGSKYLLIIPSELGYGASGYPPVIPAASTLLFEVELVSIK